MKCQDKFSPAQLTREIDLSPNIIYIGYLITIVLLLMPQFLKIHKSADALQSFKTQPDLKLILHMDSPVHSRSLTDTAIEFNIKVNKICLLKILKFQDVFHQLYSTNTRHVCTYLNVFHMVVTNNIIFKN